MRGVFLLALLFPLAVTAQEGPRRKSGIWELRMSSASIAQPMVTQQCVTEHTDDPTRAAPGGHKQCAEPVIRREGASTVVETDCKVEGSTAKTRAVLSGDFTSAYKADITVSFNPPLQGMKEQKMAVEGRWIGPCK